MLDSFYPIQKRRRHASLASSALAGPQARFVLVGGTCTLVHLALFSGLLATGSAPLLANMLAFFLATQVNFTLSYLFTWAARRRGVPHAWRTIARQALAFNLTACVTLAVNALAFSALHFGAGVPPLGSAVGAVAVSMLFSYAASSRLVFRNRTPASAPEASALRVDAATVELVPSPRLSLVTEHDDTTRTPASGSTTAGAPLRALPDSAEVTATRAQRVGIGAVGLLLLAVLVAAALGYPLGLVIVVGLVTTLYLVDLLFCAHLVRGSVRDADRRCPTPIADRDVWPSYTVLCPMYRETAVLPQFVAAIDALDYPAESLQVLLLLEEDDEETIAFARAMDLPPAFEVVVVPHDVPKTKPKACNYGLQVARGEYVVIFDAEDIPEPDQLKKAASAFLAERGNVACLQAPLNFYNPRQNVLTRLFTAEYSLWFDLMLVGLQRLDGPIPLGGTSNHFRADVLRGLGGWDPYNVTEDADLGIRLYKQGFRTGMLDSTTYEEANPSVGNWIRQRSRWIKGYMQTLLVHARSGWDLRDTRDPHFLTFLLIVGGKVVVNFINPLMWILTALYFVFRGTLGQSIEALYPPPVFYAALATLVIGNMLFVYVFLLGSARRGNHDLIKYGLLAPAYWLLMSIASCKALAQLILKPHYWEKTVHGLHLQNTEPAPTPASAVPADREEVLSR